MTMTYSIMFWSMRVLEVMFFTGLAGCSVVVFLSWVSLLGTVFSSDEELLPSEREEMRREAAQRFRKIAG